MKVSCSGARISSLCHAPLLHQWEQLVFLQNLDTHFISHLSLYCPYLLATYSFFLLTFIGFSSVPRLSLFSLLYYCSMKDKNLSKWKAIQSTIKTEDFITDVLLSLPLFPPNSFFCFTFSHMIVLMGNETLQGQGL